MQKNPMVYKIFKQSIYLISRMEINKKKKLEN